MVLDGKIVLLLTGVNTAIWGIEYHFRERIDDDKLTEPRWIADLEGFVRKCTGATGPSMKKLTRRYRRRSRELGLMKLAMSAMTLTVALSNSTWMILGFNLIYSISRWRESFLYDADMLVLNANFVAVLWSMFALGFEHRDAGLQREKASMGEKIATLEAENVELRKKRLPFT